MYHINASTERCARSEYSLALHDETVTEHVRWIGCNTDFLVACSQDETRLRAPCFWRLIERDERETKAAWEWEEERSRKQDERDQAFFQGMMATLSSSIENIGRMFMQSQSAVHQTSYPMITPGSSWSFTEPGPGPSQYPRTVTPTSSVRQPLTFRSPAPSGLRVHTVTTPTSRTTDSVRLPVRSVLSVQKVLSASEQCEPQLSGLERPCACPARG